MQESTPPDQPTAPSAEPLPKDQDFAAFIKSFWGFAAVAMFPVPAMGDLLDVLPLDEYSAQDGVLYHVPPALAIVVTTILMLYTFAKMYARRFDLLKLKRDKGILPFGKEADRALQSAILYIGWFVLLWIVVGKYDIYTCGCIEKHGIGSNWIPGIALFGDIIFIALFAGIFISLERAFLIRSMIEYYFYRNPKRA